MAARRPTSDGLRITKVGFYFLLFALIVSMAAANTGNNGLYLVLAMMAAALVVSSLMARLNVGRLAVRCEPPREVFANRPAHFQVELGNRSRWLPRWLLVTAIEPEDLEPAGAAVAEASGGRRRRRAAPMLTPRLGRRQRAHGQLELLLRRRGRRRLRALHVSSLFPLGFFRKGLRYPLDLELLVFPEVFSPSSARPEQSGGTGTEATRRAGWGHELFALRPYRHGDDPRSIHWKQSARTGELIFTERESEESRRLSIVFDNGVGELTDEATRARFERLISEAATAALDFLERGYEVELLTRDEHLPFGGGPRQRLQVLETLALVEPVPRSSRPLEAEPARMPHLSLSMELRQGVPA